MEIVIDIPDAICERFGYEYSEQNLISKDTNEAILDAFCNGALLPKGKGWIRVSEKLPKEQGLYLVTVKSRDKYCVAIDIYNTLYKKGFRILNVIAWMPLPEPYKADNEE